MGFALNILLTELRYERLYNKILLKIVLSIKVLWKRIYYFYQKNLLNIKTFKTDLHIDKVPLIEV